MTNLEVHRVPTTKTRFDLVDRILGVTIKDIKVTDPIMSKERTGYGTMKFPHIS